ncbi:MAG: 30S ribosomal protein S16 [Candidatus Komeilibacteria bacterium]
MLSIRLSRTGKKKQPYYRILVLEKSKDPWGDYLELLGNYNPRSKELVINEERLKYWISVGAQMSNTVSNLMNKNNIIESKPKKAVRISKKRQAKLKEKAETKAEAAKQAEDKPADKPTVEDEAKPTEAVVENKTEEGKEEKPAESKTEETKDEGKEEAKKEETKTE